MKTEEHITKLYSGKVEVKFLGATPDKPNRHMYYVDGKRVTGVTTYLGIKDKSRPLMIWQAETITDALLTLREKGEIDESAIITAINEPNRINQRAKDIGTETHDWVERYIKGKLAKKKDIPEMPEDPSAISAINGFLDWVKEHKVKFVSSERLVYSKKYGYVGTMDIEAEVDGDLCLVDLKTSSGLYNDVRMQTAAYLKADVEERKTKYVGRWAVRLAKESEHEFKRKWARKNHVAQVLGKKDREAPEYQAFEAEYLDGEKGNLSRDFDAFLSAKSLFEWNKETDSYVSKA